MRYRGGEIVWERIDERFVFDRLYLLVSVSISDENIFMFFGMERYWFDIDFHGGKIPKKSNKICCIKNRIFTNTHK